MNIARYSLLLMNPTIDRLDTVVAGVVFQKPSGWDVRLAENAQKMKAINPSFPDTRLVQTSALTYQLAGQAGDLVHLQRCFEGAKLGVAVDRFVGSFTFSDEADYQQQVRAVLAESVNPPSFAQANAAPISRRRNVVRRKLRDHFKARGLWSRNDQDISKHRVVEQFPISAEHGVVADFALRNSVMHITETIDFEIQSIRGRRLEAQAKTLVLSEAVRVFGANTRRYVVAAGMANPDVKQSVSLLTEYGEIFALESSTDMTRYVDAIATAAMATQGTISLP